MMRWVTPLSLDGVNVNLGPYPFLDDQSNLQTLVHEVHHVLTNALDFYYFPISNLDVNARTCGGSVGFNAVMAPNSFNKYLWGWQKPKIVTRDGFHRVRRADLSRSSFLLYDTLGNPEDYFLVENRAALPGTYDANIADSGLVVWRLDMLGMHSFFNTGFQGHTPIAIMRPDGTQAGLGSAGANGDAWDTSDPATSWHKTMVRPWRNGTPSNVALRGIGARSDSMQVFFDSRSRGLFVETGAIAAPAGAQVTVPVSALSTGSADTWTVWFGRLPKGWSSGSASVNLAAGAQTSVFLPLNIPATELPRVVTVSLYARSQTDPMTRMEREVEIQVK